MEVRHRVHASSQQFVTDENLHHMPQFVLFKLQTLSSQYFLYINIMIIIFIKYTKQRVHHPKYHRLEDIVTSLAKEVMFLVVLVSLSVCLWTTLLKKL